MTQLAEPATHVLTRGRQKKFTPERIQQIKNLVERGTSREQIAELIGVTVGSLQVTCSRLGVSLRRPNVNTGAGLLRRDGPRSSGIAGQNHNGGDIVPLQPAKERPEEESLPGPVGQAQASTACEEPAKEERAKRANEAAAANFAIRIQYRGEERTAQLPLTQDMVRQLAFEAEFRNMRIGEFIGELIVAMLKKDLFQSVLEHNKPDK
jgi:Helix-turn-helix domain of resolvase